MCDVTVAASRKKDVVSWDTLTEGHGAGYRQAWLGYLKLNPSHGDDLLLAGISCYVFCKCFFFNDA